LRGNDNETKRKAEGKKKRGVNQGEEEFGGKEES